MQEQSYFVCCSTFIFFKKITKQKGVLYSYSCLYISIFDQLWSFNLYNTKKDFVIMRCAVLNWLFFIYLYNTFFANNCEYHVNPKYWYNFWQFILFCTFKSKIVIILNFGANVIYWPVCVAKSVKLLEYIQTNGVTHKNKSYKKTQKHLEFKLLFLNLKKNLKKKNFFYQSNKIGFSVVIYKVLNYIRFFINIKAKNYFVLFIRKQRTFNKGRYSRNRQIYRTGTYWCFYINILAVFGLNFVFYKFTINFLQYWWFFFLFIFCAVFSYFIKSSLYSYFHSVKNTIHYMPKGKIVKLFTIVLSWETFESLCNLPIYQMMNFGNIITEEWLSYI
jgi:hypothetical protein